MSMLTNWGYTLTELNLVPDMMEYEEYGTYTGRSDNALSALRRKFLQHAHPSAIMSAGTCIRPKRAGWRP